MLKMLSDCGVLVSSRAHGVWLSSILGFPAIALKIENKLEQVHKSLPNSSLIVDDMDIDDVINKYVAEYSTLQSCLSDDLNAAVEKALLAENEFLDWIG